MGYRSCGKIWFSKEAEEQMNEDFVELLKELEPSIYRDTDELIYSFNGWKWYSGYADIDKIEAFMNRLDNEDIEYEFMRIGESEEDVEHRGDYEKFWLSRTIELF